MDKKITIIIVVCVLVVLAAAVVVYWQFFYKPQEKGFTPSIPEVGSGAKGALEKIDVGVVNPVESMPSTNPMDKIANPFEGGYSNPFGE